MGHTIFKEFYGCFGHRVWNQKIDERFANTSSCNCRYLHGHNFKVVPYLESPKLVHGMVTDFNHLNAFKKWLDKVVDHKTLMDIEDPMLATLLPKVRKEETIAELKSKKFYLATEANLENEQEKELYEGFVLVNFVPTAENISKWLFQNINTQLPSDVECVKIEFWETSKAGAIYTE